MGRHKTNNLLNLQDSIGSDFSAIESFVGYIAYLDIWDRVLTAFEIQEMYLSCEPFQGNLYAWSQFKLKVHGSVQVNQFSTIIDSIIYYILIT